MVSSCKEEHYLSQSIPSFSNNSITDLAWVTPACTWTDTRLQSVSGLDRLPTYDALILFEVGPEGLNISLVDIIDDDGGDCNDLCRTSGHHSHQDQEQHRVLASRTKKFLSNQWSGKACMEDETSTKIHFYSLQCIVQDTNGAVYSGSIKLAAILPSYPLPHLRPRGVVIPEHCSVPGTPVPWSSRERRGSRTRRGRR
jgi:hypothetical protein